MKLKRARPSDKLLTIDFRQLIEKVRQLIFVTDVKGNVVYLNPYGRKIITRLIGDVTKMKFSNFIAAENLAQGKELLGKIKRGEPIRPYEIDVVDRKGRRIPFLVTQSILKIGKKVVGSVGYAIDITEKRMREHEMSLRMRELSALNAIALVLNQPYDLDRLLNNTLAKILEVTETEAGGICLLDERRQELSLRVHIGLGPEVIKASSAMKIGEGISGKVAQTNRPIIIEDLGAEKRLTRPILLKEGFRSAAVVPIALWGKVIGVFNILTKNPRRYSIDEVNLLINIGNQIGIAIENA
ncbi:MAG: GAF domain-containing protein, partial [candidate division WOR-3 bacterium]